MVRERLNKEQKFIVIDYSHAYYADRGAPLPAQRSGKFVQLRSGEEEYLVFSHRELTPYHTDIVERFCAEKLLSCSFSASLSCITINDPSWTIAGGGKFDWDSDRKTIRLYDSSTAYGKFRATGLKERIGAVSEFSGYSISLY